MKLFSALFLLLAAIPALADSAFDSRSGNLKITVTEAPDTHFKHYLATYIPNSLSGTDLSHASTVIFLHGGSGIRRSPGDGYQIVNGEYTCSTSLDPHCSKEYGKEQIESYFDDSMKAFAESRKVVLMLPGTNIGWNGDSIEFLKDLKRIAITEKGLNADSFYLAGHSMGAMGVIRLSGYLRGTFKSFIALSGTLNRNEMNENYARTLLGLPLYIVNEEDALYPSFLTDSAALKEFLASLAEKYQIPSLAKIMVSHGNHNDVLAELAAVYDASTHSAQTVAVSDAQFAQVGGLPTNPPTKSKWTGNATCGKFTGTHKFHFDMFHPSKYMFIDLHTNSEGLYDESTGKVDATYDPRDTGVKFGTFDGSVNYDFVKSLPSMMARLTRDEGNQICLMKSFYPLNNNRATDDYVIVAGQSEAEALQKLQQRYQELTR